METGTGLSQPPERRTRHLLLRAPEPSGFDVVSVETIKDPSRPSNIPVEYVRAVKVGA